MREIHEEEMERATVERDGLTLPDREALSLWARIIERATLTDHSEGRNANYATALDSRQDMAHLLRYIGREDVQDALDGALAALNSVAAEAVEIGSHGDEYVIRVAMDRLRPLLYDREEEKRG